MIVYNRVSNIYALNINQMKYKMSLIINDINEEIKYRTAKEIALNSYPYIVTKRMLRLYLCTNITSYNNIFLELIKSTGLYSNRNRTDDDLIVYKTILLKLGTIRSVCKKEI